MPLRGEVFFAVPLLEPAPLFELTLEFDNIQWDVVHVLVGCAREWPHKGVMCCAPNVVLGEE